MFNWSKERTNKPAQPALDETALRQREVLKALEEQVPEVRMKLLTGPEEAAPMCKNLLAKIYQLDADNPKWNEKEQHRRDVLEMSLLNFLAQALTDRGNWDEAASSYERGLAIGARLQVPDFQAVNLLNLGKCYRHAGNLERAAFCFEQAIALCQTHNLTSQQAEAFYQRAVIGELQHRPAEALNAYQQGLALSEGERLYSLAVRFLSQLGQLQQSLGEYTSALQYYERCLQLLHETDDDKESETIILGQISHVCVQIDDFKRGIAAARQGLELSRQTGQKAEEAAFLNDLTRLLMGYGDVKEAKVFGQQAHQLAKQRGDAEALREAEQLLRQLGTDVDGNTGTFQTMSELIQIPEVHYQRGNQYYRDGALDRAIAAYSRAINLDPKMTSAYVNRGSAYAAKGNYDRALADYNQAVQLDPADMATRFNRGNVYRKRREYSLALNDYSEAIRLDPTDPDAYFNRGEVLRRMKRLPEAAADFQRVIKLSAGKDEAGAEQARRLLQELDARPGSGPIGKSK